MTSIRVDYQPSEWKCVWLYPSHSLFEQIMVWEWQRVHNEDDFLDDEYPLDMTTHDDWIDV